MCKKIEEFIDHLMIHCEVVKRFMELTFQFVWC
jgi:hypothetical protein